MKTLAILILAISLAVAPAVAGDVGTPAVPRRVWLILDCSSSNRGAWNELQVLSKAVARELRPGDRIRVVATTANEPRLIVLEQLMEGDAIRKEIIRAIGEVHPEDGQQFIMERRSFFGRLFGENYRYTSVGGSGYTDVMRALELPLSIISSEVRSGAHRDMVILVSCAEWTDTQAQACLAVNEKLRAAGVTVIFTGTKSANRTLVLNAARGLVTWHELSFCDPSMWLAEAGKAPTQQNLEQKDKPAPSEEAQPSASTGQKPQPETESTKVRPVSQGIAAEQSTGPSRDPAAGLPREAEGAESHTTASERAKHENQAAPVLDVSVPPRIIAEPGDMRHEIPEETAPATAKPAGDPDAPTVITLSAGKSPIEIRIRRERDELDVSKTADRATNVAKGSTPHESSSETAGTSLEETDSHSAAKDALPATPILEPARHPETTSITEDRTDDHRSTTPSPATDGESRQNAQRHPDQEESIGGGVRAKSTGRQASSGYLRQYWYLWLGMVLLGLIAVGAFLPDFLRSRRAMTEGASVSSPHGNKPCEVVARVNGTDHVLGSAANATRLHVGSGPANALRISEKGVEQHHIELRGGPQWKIRNLSRKPLQVNDRTLAAGARAAIDFPATIHLAEKSSFRLFLRPIRKADEELSGAAVNISGSH